MRQVHDTELVLTNPCAQSVVRMQTVTGACRCIKFGEGPVDLLAFAEHSDYCHLVDTRAFMERQVWLSCDPPVSLPVHGS